MKMTHIVQMTCIMKMTHAVQMTCVMKNIQDMEGDKCCEGHLRDTDPFSELLAEMVKPPAVDTWQATPAAEGLVSYECSFITKVILRLLINLGESTLPLHADPSLIFLKERCPNCNPAYMLQVAS